MDNASSNGSKSVDMPELDRILEELPYPEEFTGKYELYELLAEKNVSDTFLATGKNDKKKYVVKCCDRVRSKASINTDLIKNLSHEHLPKYVDFYENDRVFITVREYAEGKPLSIISGGRPMAPNHAISICIQLCDILSYLHNLPSPVIHKDIKPDNIIIGPDCSVTLIDFETARQYRDGAGRDTYLFATPGYAPPEQYGFSQTDSRTDIYSLGVLLRWMLTGSEKPSADSDMPASLGRIVDKCTEFSPGDRYADAEELKSALIRVKKTGLRAKRFKPSAAHVIIPLLCLLAFGAGFLFGRTPAARPDAGLAAVSGTDAADGDYIAANSDDAENTDDITANGDDAGNGGESLNGIVFKEPLIELSVRMQLGKTNGEPLTEEDLGSVEGIYVVGTDAFADCEDAMNASFNGIRGDISTLEDARLFPNAFNLIVRNQTLSDISAIEGLTNLRNIWLENTFVSDVSVFASLPDLESVFLSYTKVTDLTVFDQLPRLRDVYLGSTAVPLEKIGGRGSIKLLNINDRHFDSFEGLRGFDRLEELGLDDRTTASCSFDPLLDLPSLKIIRTNRELADGLSETFRGRDVQIIAD